MKEKEIIKKCNDLLDSLGYNKSPDGILRTIEDLSRFYKKAINVALKEQAEEIHFEHKGALEHQLVSDDIIVRDFDELMKKYTGEQN